jgi:hypothetical protein
MSGLPYKHTGRHAILLAIKALQGMGVRHPMPLFGGGVISYEVREQLAA